MTKDIKNFWDERYAGPDFVYGKTPNGFFKSHIDASPPGKLLLPGEGEGRNAVYAAALGWDVFAFDKSRVARNKALDLAREKSVRITYEHGSLLDVKLEMESFDLIALVYFHLDPRARVFYHRHMVKLLKPKGNIILEVFSKEQLHRKSGGPKEPDLLYTTTELKEDFNELNILRADEEVIQLNEGLAHSGDAAVIRFIGQKS